MLPYWFIMKNRTLIGITHPIPREERYGTNIHYEREIRFFENPTTHNVVYATVESVVRSRFELTDFLDGAKITSHELKNLIIYED